ncbi:Peptidyl-prolyl cis-trans isomerase D [Diplonema papillatum]|nr:Peptidyl-prolyl cis-trans isomerase D [Diplonema papillatum]
MERRQGATYLLAQTRKAEEALKKKEIDAKTNPLIQPLPQDWETWPNPIVYLVVSQGKKDIGKIVLELFANICPLTAENFRCLCTGEEGKGNSGTQLRYAGSIFHRITATSVQGGDIVSFNGTDGDSIYGTRFAHENFTLRHTGPGVLSMISNGPDANNSQFLITHAAAPALDGKQTAFGRVVDGLSTVRKLALLSVVDSCPLDTVVVSEAGQMNRTPSKTRAQIEREEELRALDRERVAKEKEDERKNELEPDDEFLTALKDKVRRQVKRKVVAVGEEPDAEEADEAERIKDAKKIVKKSRRRFF